MTDKPTEGEDDRMCLAVLCADEMLKAANARAIKNAISFENVLAELNTANARIADLTHRLAGAQARDVAATARAEVAERTSMELNRALYQAEKERDAANEAAQEWEHLCRKAEARADAAERGLAAEKGARKSEGECLEELRPALAAARRGLYESESEVAVLRDRADAAEQRFMAAEDEIRGLESEAAALRAETAKLRDERETYAAEVVDLRAEVERLRAAHSTNFAGEHKRSSALRNTRDTALSKLAAAESSLAGARALLDRCTMVPHSLLDDIRKWQSANPESPNLCWKCGARKPTNFAREDGCSDCGASGTPEPLAASCGARLVHRYGR